MTCLCGESMEFLWPWDDAQLTNHCFNLYACVACGRVARDSLWEDPGLMFVELDGSVTIVDDAKERRRE